MSFVFPSFKKLALDGDIDLLNDTIKCVLIDEDTDTPTTADDYLDDIASGARIGTPQTLGNKSTDGGVFDADDVTFSSVTGNTCEGVLIYKDTGDEATSPLIAYLNSGTGLPVTPNGGDIQVQWDDGTNKIFKL